MMALLILSLSACVEKTAAPDFLFNPSSTIDDGDGGGSGDPSEPPVPPTPTPQITLTTTINYTTNIIQEDQYLVAEQATYTIPSLLTATFGNSGQGWLQLDIDSLRYCYKGAAKKISNTSLIYNLIHSTNDLVNPCGLSADLNLTPAITIEIFNGETVTLNLEQGICGNKCLDTQVTIILVPVI